MSVTFSHTSVDDDEPTSPTLVYLTLAANGVVHSLSDFLELTLAQTELFLLRLGELHEKLSEVGERTWRM